MTKNLSLPVVFLHDTVVLPGMVVPIELDDQARAAIDAAQLAATAAGLVRVINATGVVLHTGLGRAPLPARAAAAAARAGQGYVDLEVDRGTGARERRSTRAERLLTSMTGAEDALVVNNGAAALLLARTAIKVRVTAAR